MSITFIGMGSRSSGKVRGVQIASQNKNYNFYDTETRKFTHGNPVFMSNVIFVRNFNPSLARNLKDLGAKIGFDIIDRPVAELHKLQRTKNSSVADISWSILCNETIDFYIVTNSKAKKRLEEVTEKPVHVIPHQAVSSEIILKNIEKKPKVIGYLGTKDQLYARKNIKNLCKINKLEFYENHPMTRQECIDDLRKIDIGIIYLERNNRTNYVLEYKPNQKLTNFQCFGIPAIICEYESYKEFGGKESYLLANSTEDIENCIEKLIMSIKLRKDIQKNGYIAAERLLVKNIVKEYDFITKQ